MRGAITTFSFFAILPPPLAPSATHAQMCCWLRLKCAPRQTFPASFSGHDSLCMIDSDTIIMTDSHLGNHLVEKFSENKTSAPIEACFTTMCAGNSNGLAIRINSGTDPTGPFHGELPFRSLLLHPSCEPE